jgi:ammonia channel protein AmtB
MEKEQCPKCGQFKFDKGWDGKGCGCFMLIGVPLIGLLTPGMSSFYGGNSSFDDMFPFVLISMGLGLVVLIFSLIFPSKTVTYKCGNCDFEQKYNK